jgi:hypothetical protein
LNGELAARIANGLDRAIPPEVSAVAARLAAAGATGGDVRAVFFYGSNLRTGALDGVLDFYCLTDGGPERGIWPRVSYHEMWLDGAILRAKVATMTLATFAAAARGELLDTTIWARFVQPSALVWARDDAVREAVMDSLGAAAITAARLAALVGSPGSSEAEHWTALFDATYDAELRVEPRGRSRAIVLGAPEHFDGLLQLAWKAAGVPFEAIGGTLSARLDPPARLRLARWWRWRRRAGKWLNLVRLARATTTFEGAARYAAWKIERHTGVAIALTPWRERHPLLAAPGALWTLWRSRAARPRQG